MFDELLNNKVQEMFKYVVFDHISAINSSLTLHDIRYFLMDLTWWGLASGILMSSNHKSSD